MGLSAGTRLGPYEIIAPLGAGGMGEVYRACDTRLTRTVAIKILPPHLAEHPDLRDRFTREAQAIASLNHPHICVLYDVSQHEGTDFLVMEHLEGETLAQRLTRGALPVDQTLRYAIEIADALDQAHRQGIVHRVLKPANVMLTKSGTKLLDFGLAKLRATDAAPGPGLSVLPTERGLTARGTILGTFQYMAPEQLEGKETDARADIFAFGALMYEMATGRKAFESKSQASLISAIMSAEPPPMSAVQPMTPPALDHVVKKCLAKDPDDRWQSAGDLASELRWVAEAGSQAGAAAPVVVRRMRREQLGWIVAAVLLLGLIAAVAVAVGHLREVRKEPHAARFLVAAPEKSSFRWYDAPVVSPDGRQIAFTPTGAVP
jgi:serine/threonine protein kinase